MLQQMTFDSRPLKVKNRFDFLARRWCATYCWKVLNNDYSFLQTSFQLKVCTQSYMSRESQPCEFRDSHLGTSGQNVIWVLIMWPSTKYTIKGKVVASPKSRLWWILWVCVCSWLVCAPKVFKLRTNQLVVWFVQVRMSNWCLLFFLIPILELQHAHVPPKCCKPGSVPQLLILLLFSPHTHIWIYQGAWERINYHDNVMLTLLLIDYQNLTHNTMGIFWWMFFETSISTIHYDCSFYMAFNYHKGLSQNLPRGILIETWK
jgi:hypothetical protein